MSAEASERMGVVVVRAWVEDDGSVRARVTASSDLAPAEEEVWVAAGIEEIVEVVRAWLERLGGVEAA